MELNIEQLYKDFKEGNLKEQEAILRTLREYGYLKDAESFEDWRAHEQGLGYVPEEDSRVDEIIEEDND